MAAPLKTFVIYARKDESFKNDLLLHLSTLVSTGHLQVWQDGEILPGEDWEKKIEQQLEASDLFLVLLSIHSLTSAFIQKKELVKALEKKSRIVPILVRSCFWQTHPIFAGLQGLPKNMKPVASFADHDDAWTEIMAKLHEMVETIRAEEKTQRETAQRQASEREAQKAAALAEAERQKQAAAEKRRREAEARKEGAPEMVFVKGGTFQMGDEHGDLHEGCRPVHPVTLSDFQIGKYPVTQKEWTALMGNNPSAFKGEQLPVENVSWEDCQAFLKKLNEKTGQPYRLPTEAEWEYAARGGAFFKHTKYAGSNNLDEVAWYAGNAGSKTHPVGQKKANQLGLFDMSGNVWEWCSDWYGPYKDNKNPVLNPKGADKGEFRVYRGGSWNYYARGCRVSNRFNYTPAARRSYLGFRLVLQ